MKWGVCFSVCAVLLAWGGSATAATLHVPGGYPSIQAAIEAAVSGRDRIQVAPGTYYEAIDFRGKAIELYSRRGSAVTIIDGTGHDHVVRCATGEGPSTILRGFTITGGNADGKGEGAHGGGMYNSACSPTVMDCLFTGNSAVAVGGGMFNQAASPKITGCTFRGNAAPWGGAMGNLQGSAPAVTDGTFADNAALDGGGMFNSAGSPVVTHCTFRGNAADWGGGMYNETGSPALNGCTFCDNSANRGGGISNWAADPTVTECTFRDNAAELGGGLFNEMGSRPAVTDGTFTGNLAESGGGIASLMSRPAVIGCTFLENTAAGAGGGMYNGEGDPIVTRCTFRQNCAATGGGLHNDLSNPLVTNCLFTANTASDSGGGMISLSSRPTVTHCTFSGNTAASTGGGMSSMGIESISIVTNCILWSNAGGQLGGAPATLVVTYSDVQGGWAGAGNLDADPLFVDVAGGDYRLLEGSPCIDAGTNTPAGGLPPTDLDGNPRPADGNGDGVAVADLGAYEVPVAISGRFVNDLLEDVLDLSLEPAVTTSLTAPLQAALSLLSDGNAANDVGVAGALAGFTSTVTAYRGTKLAASDADALLAAAQALSILLGGK